MGWRSINIDLEVLAEIDLRGDEFQSRNDVLRELLGLPDLEALTNRREKTIPMREIISRKTYGLGKLEIGETLEIPVPGGVGSSDHNKLQFSINNQMYRKDKRFEFEWDHQGEDPVAIITRIL